MVAAAPRRVKDTMMTHTHSPPSQIPGATVISEKALVATAKATAAEVLAVPPGEVAVQLKANGTGLGCHVTGPIGAGSTGSLLTQAHQATARIAYLVTGRTGRDIGAVTLHIDGLYTAPRRVR